MADEDLGAIPIALRRLLEQVSDPNELLNVAKRLKETRNYTLLAWFTERILRNDRRLEIWQLHVQALVELGFLSAAGEVLDGIDNEVASAKPGIAVDLIALKGRIAKQRFADTPELGKVVANEHLKKALEHYKSAHRRAGDDASLRYFPGINIVALLSWAKRLNIELPAHYDLSKWIDGVTKDLAATEASDATYHWWIATKAECCVAQGDSEGFCSAVIKLVKGRKTPSEISAQTKRYQLVQRYLESVPDVDESLADAFVLSSFHRQLTEIWDVDSLAAKEVKQANDVKQVVLGLRQALLERNGGSLEFDSATLVAITKLQAVLGDDGPLPYDWVLQGIDRARSVAALLRKDSFGELKRVGTAFLVAVKSEGKGDSGSVYALTNAHNISDKEPQGANYPLAHDPKEIWLRFEAVNPDRLVEVEAIEWTSPIREHDATILRLKDAPINIAPLRPSRTLPVPAKTARVYVIGHPKGDKLHMSLQDNELLDHENRRKPPPAVNEPVRIHYRAPTREGSSGSPVFAQDGWRLIALHRAEITQGEATISLSGYRYYRRANEGVSLSSIDTILKHQRPDLSLSFDE